VALYDLRDDPGEEHDVAGRHPEKAGELRRRLQAWRESVDAAMPEANPRFREPKPPRS